MKKVAASLLASLLAAVLPAAGAPPPRVPDAFTPVVARTLGRDPVPVRGSDGRWHVVYELWLTNTRPVPASLERLEILAADNLDRVLLALDGDTLQAAMRDLAARPTGDRTLAPDSSRLVLVELEFASRAEVPAAIVHRLSGSAAEGPAARAPGPIRDLVAPLPISTQEPPVLAAPLRGGGWVVMNGCCSGRGAHRAAILPVAGRLSDAQRFAIDWVRVDAEGRLVAGDPARAESHLAYDQPVFAVAAGTVVAALDGLEDQVPGSLPDPATITIENVDGNHVIIDIGGGFHAFFAHLKKGTVRVKAGERVAAGQEIGRLGNTGNSSAPHLHLHVMRGPSALADDGAPFVLAEFGLAGMLDPEQWYATDSDIATTYRILPGDGRGPRSNELPLDLRIVDLPEAPR